MGEWPLSFQLIIVTKNRKFVAVIVVINRQILELFYCNQGETAGWALEGYQRYNAVWEALFARKVKPIPYMV